MLEKEFQFYLDHQADLVKKYNGKHIVIQGDQVIGAYDSEIDAYTETSKTHALGTFLIQYCTKGEQAYTQNFSSRVIFA